MHTVRHAFLFFSLSLCSMRGLGQPVCPLDAGHDTAVCSPTGVQLSASSGFDTYAWTPSIGLDNPSIHNPVATVAGDITYVVTATAASSNLVTNGDFSAGNVGFTNDYTFQIFYNPCYYTVLPTFFDEPSAVPDHSPSADNMFMSIDGCYTPSVLWEQTINPIIPNANYDFSFWATRASAVQPIFAIYFIGNVTGLEALATLAGIIPLSNGMVWDEYTVPTWNSGNNTSVSIRIKCMTSDGYGVDFAMDDISLQGANCISTDSIHISYFDVQAPVMPNDTTVCQHVVLPQLQAIGQNIQWYTSPTSGIGSGISPVPNTTGHIPVTYYATQTVQGCESDWASFTVDMVAIPYFDLGPDAMYCIGDEFKIGPDIDLPNQYTWMDSLHTTPRLISDANTTEFVLQAQNFCGTYIDSVKITWDECLCYFYYPNSFTPDDDIHNEVFKPIYNCRLEEYTIRIFNRWGEPVFESMNPDEGWAGQYKNHPAQQDIYIVQINYTALSGSKKIHKSITDKLALVK